LTKQDKQKNVLKGLKAIHSLQVNGDILFFLRELRDNRDKVESFARNFDSKLKEIYRTRVAENKVELDAITERDKQSDIVAENSHNENITIAVADADVEKKDFKNSELSIEQTESKNSSEIIENGVVQETKEFTTESTNISSDKKEEEVLKSRQDIRTRQSSNQRNKEQLEHDGKAQTYDKKRTFDISKQKQSHSQRSPYQKSQNYDNRRSTFVAGGDAGKKLDTTRQSSDRQFSSKPFVATKANNFKNFAKSGGGETAFQPRERQFGNKNKPGTKRSFGKDRENSLQLNRKNQRRFTLDINSEVEERVSSRKIARPKKQQQTFVAPSIENAVMTTETISVKMLSEKIGKPVPEIIKKLMILGVMATINSNIDFATAELISMELGIKLEQKIEKSKEEKLLDVSKLDEDDKDAQISPPVVTVMGHVDHGKTSLLDAIRKTNIASDEAGGITQRIGAYSITHNNSKITFIDTPGHAAFTAMRARGAKITNIAILVVAADDGVMPQTIEAINHIKAAEVPMIVAINKMDSLEANPEKIKTQLASNGVLPEEWGGDTIIVPVSAKTGVGINELMNMVLLVAEMQGIKANPKKMAVGTIIEAALDKNRGPIATVLVQNGTLRIGDSIMSGITFGKVRAMFDENGQQVKEATPSTPVAVLGFYEVPDSGDQVFAISEKLSKQIIEERKQKIKEEKAQTTSGVSIDDFMTKVNESKLKTLNIIIKADVQGSVEALNQSLTAIANEEVRVVCVHSGVGPVTESDLVLAKTSDAFIVNFNLKVSTKVQGVADNLGVEIKSYKIIYEVVDDITNAITGMLTIKYEQKITGHAEVRKVFKLSTSGLVAGSYVIDGKILRKANARLIRDGEVIGESEIIDLKILKDDKAEVTQSFECGIKLKDLIDIKENDIIECYENVEIKRQ
jgi:translation initiation factor IF-2